MLSPEASRFDDRNSKISKVMDILLEANKYQISKIVLSENPNQENPDLDPTVVVFVIFDGSMHSDDFLRQGADIFETIAMENIYFGLNEYKDIDLRLLSENDLVVNPGASPFTQRHQYQMVKAINSGKVLFTVSEEAA